MVLSGRILTFYDRKNTFLPNGKTTFQHDKMYLKVNVNTYYILLYLVLRNTYAQRHMVMAS